ncbi:MAG: hypothetical protein L6461_13300 [Anaerolineae bacterium]|nr:hypothetical protein [Anaerolineae bacterium]
MKLETQLSEELTKKAIKIKRGILQNNTRDEVQSLEQYSGITVRFVELDGLVRLLIEISDKTTHQDIRNAIPNILTWRDQLLEKQSDEIGYDLLKKIDRPSNRDELLERFSYQQEHGAKYSDLAEHFNRLVGGCLKKYWEIQQKKSINTDELITMKLTLVYAENLLKAVGLDQQDILKYGLENLSNKEPVFEKGYPVSRQKMIEVLRNWRKSRLHNAVSSAIEKARQFKKEQNQQV